MYSTEPLNRKEYTEKFDQTYSHLAKIYDLVVRWVPIWRNWISTALPHISGPNVLEISFGTGYLLTRYANEYFTCGIDYNWELTHIARQNLLRADVRASLQQADVEYLPYRSESFDTVVNTMAFTGYPDGQKALAEIHRVIKKEGRLVLVDINYPLDQNWLGMKCTRLWASAGDIIRDLGKLLKDAGFEYIDNEIGGFGSVHLYVATKRS